MSLESLPRTWYCFPPVIADPWIRSEDFPGSELVTRWVAGQASPAMTNLTKAASSS